MLKAEKQMEMIFDMGDLQHKHQKEANLYVLLHRQQSPKTYKSILLKSKYNNCLTTKKKQYHT